MKEKLKKIPKRFIIAAVVILMVLSVLVMHRSIFENTSADNYDDMTGTNAEYSVEKGELKQYFTITEDMHSVEVLMTNHSGREATVTAELYDAQMNELISSAQALLPNSTGEETVNLALTAEHITKPEKVYFVLKTKEAAENVSYCVQEGSYEERMLQNAQQTDARLRMSVIYGSTMNYGFFMVVMLAVIAVVLAFCVPAGRAKPEKLFAMMAVVIGLAIAVINPPFQECDGPDHLIRSMDVSYGNVLGSFANLTHENGIVYIPENFGEIQYKTLQPNSGEGTAFINNLKSHDFAKNKMTMEFDGSVTSIVYWPQGFGIWLGRTLSLSMYGVILLGRIFNLLAYVVLTYLAVKFMPVYKNLLALIALLPITLYQAASLSQDSVLNGMGFLFVALCCYYAFGQRKEKLTWKNALLLGVLLFGLFLGKYVYACLGLLVFMIPKDKFENRKQYWKSFVIALLPLIILGGYIMLHVSSGIGNLQAGAGTGGMTQTEYLKANPLAIIKVMEGTVLGMLDTYLRQLTIFGNLILPLGMLGILCPCFIAAVGCLDTNELSRDIKIKHRVLALAAFAVTFAAVLLGLYIGDGIANPVGSQVVSGVQGRYFLIILILPFLTLGSKKIKNEISNFSGKVIGIMGCMLLYAVFMLLKSYY